MKELILIVVNAAKWGQNWSGSQVLFRSDKKAVVLCLSFGVANDPHLAHLLWCLFFFKTEIRFKHQTKHIAG